MAASGTGASGGWEELARGAADGTAASEESAERLHLIGFRLGDVAYAVRVESVREIVRMRPITPVPRVASAVRGVISLRGEMVQVIDLRMRLRMPAAEPTRNSRIVVVHLPDGRVAGLLVDEVREVMRVEADAALPASGEGLAVDSLCVRDDEFVSLLSLERVLALEGDG
jgi:purine-binding chemotaxis protein CheW